MSDREHDTHPEHGRFGNWWVGGWFAPLAVTAFTLLWCLVIYLLIGDRPVSWRYGAAPYVPAESVLSSEGKPAGAVPNQVVLPEEDRGGRNAKR